MATDGKRLVFRSKETALEYIFRTRRRLDDAPRGLDEDTRDTTATRELLRVADLPAAPCEYVVLTGSRGKGSVASIMAKLLQAARVSRRYVNEPTPCPLERADPR